MPTETRADTDPQRYLLSTVRQSQAAVIDTIRTWTTVTEQLTRTLRVPVPKVDFAAAVDRVFDVAEQTLAVQRQLALTVAGVATRRVDTALETVDTAVAAAVEAGAVGARMTGAGFGGSAIALVPVELAGKVGDRTREAFAAAGFGPPEVTAVVPSDGARRLA